MPEVLRILRLELQTNPDAAPQYGRPITDTVRVGG